MKKLKFKIRQYFINLVIEAIDGLYSDWNIYTEDNLKDSIDIITLSFKPTPGDIFNLEYGKVRVKSVEYSKTGFTGKLIVEFI